MHTLVVGRQPHQLPRYSGRHRQESCPSFRGVSQLILGLVMEVAGCLFELHQCWSLFRGLCSAFLVYSWVLEATKILVGSRFGIRCVYCAAVCVAVCCSVLQCVAVCCSVLQCIAVCCRVLQCVAVCCCVLQCVAVCCSVLQCVAVCCSVLQCVAVCCV